MNQDDLATLTEKVTSLRKREKNILFGLLTPLNESHEPGGLFYKDTLTLLKSYNEIVYDSYKTRYEELFSYLEGAMHQTDYPSYFELLEHQAIFNCFSERSRQCDEEGLATIITMLIAIEFALKELKEKENPIFYEIIYTSFINPKTYQLPNTEKAGLLGLTKSGYHYRLRTAVHKYSIKLWGKAGEHHRVSRLHNPSLLDSL